MEHRITLTYDAHPDEDRIDEMLDLLVADVPHMGPVLATGPEGLRVTLALDAPTASRALELAAAAVTSSLGRDHEQVAHAEVTRLGVAAAA